MANRLLLSIFIGVLIFLACGPFIKQYAEGQFEQEYIDYEKVEVGEEINQNGFRQIYINYNGDKTLLTTENTTHSAVSWEGEYVTWMSQINSYWQIFVHHIPTSKTIQLTNTGNNVNPQISQGNIVWEGQIKGIWQAFLYNGSKIHQITTSSTPIQNVNIDTEYIVYSKKREDSKGKDIYFYNLQKNVSKKLTENEPGINPVINNGVINWETYKNNNLAYYEYDINKDKITLIKDVYISTKETSASFGETEGFNVNSYINFLRSIGRSPTPALKLLLEE